ncbi:MAG: hypothetical protein IPP13_21640 [Kouleothrix sp.]|jgi:HK97 gp10 family phage protein|nr:hypothetical protein [Kouleothrix sp.]
MSAEVTIDGFTRVLGNLPDMLNAGAQASAEKAVQLAKANVVVGKDPPHTRDTIEARRVGEAQYEVSAEEAAIFIELGTSKMPARPFLLPAATDAQTLEAFVDAVKAALT